MPKVKGSSNSHFRATAEFKVWEGMLDRCTRQAHEAFHRYGGRGIRVCERWRNSIALFVEDVGKRPDKTHTLDRIDNDGNYSCGHCDECRRNGWTANCRWTTRAVQRRNCVSVWLISHNSKEQCLRDWAKELGIAETTLKNRLWRGWTTQRAFETPANPNRFKKRG